ncbi:hypothetical protein [uncultured Aliiroseovarius sp.]|uniref:hypothetical protein n=1 Tax=uncultured Aliiroseovarius sp. TaxID=1658783 RepID=UPI002614BFFE|nr:hypothetical protein [uncultured Aliiroseovarius sp.]
MSLRLAFWLAFAAATVVYLAMVLWALPIISGDAGGLMPFDLRPFGYTTDEARMFLSALGDTGRAQYLGPQHKLDTLYPGLLALSLILAYFLLFPPRWAIGFASIAALGAIFDWNENSAVADLLRLGVDRIDEEVVSIAALFTMLKSVTVTVALSIFLAGVMFAVWQRWRRQTG